VYALILFSVDAFPVLGCSVVVVVVVVVVLVVVFVSFFLLNMSRKPICKIAVSNLDINN